jgi:hypothetical protein
MKSRATLKFWRMFDALPVDVQDHARRTYEMWRANPAHPSLQFKRVSRRETIYSVRIGLAHRALGLLDGDTVT